MNYDNKKQVPVLAMYNIRSKQKFIYETNRIKSIVGASHMITDAFKDYLYDEAIYQPKNEAFSFKDMLVRLGVHDTEKTQGAKTYCGEIIYEGGGNLFVVYKSEDDFVRYNKKFCRNLLINTNGLTPLFACVPVSENYQNDRKALQEKCDILKKQQAPLCTVNTLPFVLMDRNVWEPITKKTITPQMEFTARNAAKQKKYDEKKVKFSEQEIENVKFLDDLCTQKGSESLLAVVYIDGNNIGNKFANILDKKTDYDSCITTLRNKSCEVNNVFVNNGIKAVQENLSLQKTKAWRSIVGGGDEITFICNARCALQLAKAYLESVQTSQNGAYSSCAGIAIFHSHYPFSKAYAIAEQCCEQAKTKLRSDFAAHREICGIDFHYIHSGVEEDLDEIRKLQYAYADKNVFLARPYVFGITEGMNAKMQNVEKLDALCKVFKENNVAHSVIKELGTEICDSTFSAKKVLLRMESQKTKLKEKLDAIEPDETKLLQLIFDFSEMYDLWFSNT
ncbi:MAG: hypothetical protein RR777_03250 [Christensenellaceae bacterium]